MRYQQPSPQALATVLDLHPNEFTDVANLTVMQAAFVEHYVATLNAGKSARDAGFTDPHAGSRLLRLPKVIEAIQARRLRMQSMVQVECYDLIRELTAIAFSNIDDHASWNEEGIVRHVPKNELSRNELAAIKKMKTKVTTRQDEDGVMITDTQVEFEFHSKLDAIKQLRDILGISTESAQNSTNGQNATQSSDLPDFRQWPVELLQKFEKFLDQETAIVIEADQNHS